MQLKLKNEIEFPLIKILLRVGDPAKYFAPSLLSSLSGLLQAEPADRQRSSSTQEEVFDIGLAAFFAEWGHAINK